MKLLRLTALSSLLFAVLLNSVSCEKESELKKVNVYRKDGLLLTGAQSVPATPSAATGTLSVYYDKRFKTLYFTLTWQGLSGNVTSIGIHGPAPEGYAALSSTGLAPALQSISGSGLGPNGSYSGNLFMDDTYFREETLLNYLYYIRINTAAIPTGEIRTQIKFQ